MPYSADRFVSDGTEISFPVQDAKDPSVIALAIAEYLSKVSRNPDGSFRDPEAVEVAVERIKALAGKGEAEES